jgi:hypothetical protein
MKKKVKIKSLPKAQFAGEPPIVLTPQQQDIWKANQNMFGFYGDVTEGSTNTTPALPTGDALVMDKSSNKEITSQKPLDDLSNLTQIAGMVPLIQTGIFANMGKKREQNKAEDQFKNRFLSDSLYASIPEGYSGNRGDYTLNYGTGLNFRPDEAVYGQFGKIAQYGGQMKRKIKITGLPQQAYGGTQNTQAVDEMYPYNSNVRRSNYSNMLGGEDESSVRQYAEEVPREIANIEAEAGETIVKPSDNGILNMYKIGGKRHSEGGTPLQAGGGDFIFSDTKDMKIKDPAILESFGMSYKKGGYTPAKISKKFNLNNPDIQKTLNDPTADIIARSTAKRMYDNNLSQLGKLALVQEARKGFPQGPPSISMPYMQKVGMDPSMFMPDVMTPQDAQVSMGKAQRGQQFFNPTYSVPGKQPFGLGYPMQLPDLSQPLVANRSQAASPATPVAIPTVSNAPVASYTGFDPSSIYGSDSYITKYGKSADGKVRVMLDPNASYEDKVRLAEEATALNFGKNTKSPILQGRTEGYKHFYAGLTPSDFEKRFLQGFMNSEDVESMTAIERRKKFFNELGIDIDEKKLNDPKLLYNDDEWLNKTFYPAFKSKLPKEQYRSQMGDDFNFGLEHFDNLGKKQTSTKTTDKIDSYAQDPLVAANIARRPSAGVYPQDVMNLGLALGNRLGINKYMPYDVAMPQPMLMDPTFYDPSRELAANAEMANLVTQNLGQFAGPQALSSRASQIQGSGLKGAADILGRYNNLNVGVANQFEQSNKALINDFNMKNALAKSNYYDKTVIANQQYDNSKRTANAEINQQAVNALENKRITDLINMFSSNYAVDPTTGGTVRFIEGTTPSGQKASTSTSVNALAQLRAQFEQDPDFKTLSPKDKFDVLSKFIPKESAVTRKSDLDSVLMNALIGRGRR